MTKHDGIIYSPVTGLSADIYIPDNTNGVPLLVYFHGGGLEGGDRKENSATFELLAQNGIAVVSADYRMYPNARFPEYIEDAARAVAWAQKGCGGYFNPDRIYVGGASAGAYISMLLCFNGSYLSSFGADISGIDGFIFDAGQPTVHFNVLRERGEDTRLIRVDDASPLYFLEPPDDNYSRMRYLFIAADNDIPCRLEQLRLMTASMRHLGYPEANIGFELMEGFGHCSYHGVVKDGHNIYYEILKNFIAKK